MSDFSPEELSQLLSSHYGIMDADIRFLRQGGSSSYLVDGSSRYLLKAIGSAFLDTVRSSVSVMRYLHAHAFPVPEVILTRSGEDLLKVNTDGQDRFLLLCEFIDGQEPDLSACAAQAGELTALLHSLLAQYPEPLLIRDRHFFIDRYLDFLRAKNYPRIASYEALGDLLWQQVACQPITACHGDLHRGNLLQTKHGDIYFLDFETVCRAPAMFDNMVLCDMTDYFRLAAEDIDTAMGTYESFLSGYCLHRPLSRDEIRSFPVWVAIRHFQLQATILELYGMDCIDEAFIDRQLDWLHQWTRYTIAEIGGTL